MDNHTPLMRVYGSFPFIPPCQYMINHSDKRSHVSVGVANNMQPLSWEAQTEKILLIIMLKYGTRVWGCKLCVPTQLGGGGGVQTEKIA